MKKPQRIQITPAGSKFYNSFTFSSASKVSTEKTPQDLKGMKKYPAFAAVFEKHTLQLKNPA